MNLDALKSPAGLANMLAFLEYPRHEIVGALVARFPGCKAEQLTERAIGEHRRREREGSARVERYQRAIEEEHRDDTA